MMTSGFVALPRKIMTLPIWQKPPYYIKVFLYIYLNANYISDDNLKRGEVVVDLDELAAMCSSGKGGSYKTHTKKDIYRAIKYFSSETSEMNVKSKSLTYNKMLVTLLNYDDFTNSKVLEKPPSNRCDTDEKISTIIYNNNNNKNNKQIESRAAQSVKVKPTAFCNFKSRERDFDDIKQKAKEKLRRKSNEQQN